MARGNRDNGKGRRNQPAAKHDERQILIEQLLASESHFERITVRLCDAWAHVTILFRVHSL